MESTSIRYRKVTVEHEEDGWCLTMTERGHVRQHPTAEAVVCWVRARDRAALRRSGTSTVTLIEWINPPVGFCPPAAAGRLTSSVSLADA